MSASLALSSSCRAIHLIRCDLPLAGQVFERLVIAENGQLPIGETGCGKKVGFDLEFAPAACFDDKIARRRWPACCRIINYFYPLIFRPGAHQIRGGRIGGQIAGLDVHAGGIDAPDFLQVGLDALRLCAGKDQDCPFRCRCLNCSRQF